MCTLTNQLQLEVGLKDGAYLVPADFAKNRPASALLSLCHLANINPLKIIRADWQAACLTVQAYASQLNDSNNPIISISVAA